MTARRSWIAGITFLILIGCGSPAAPPPDPPNADETAAAGSYALLKVDGGALPTTSAVDAFGCKRNILAGTLTLTTDPQAYNLTVQLQSSCDPNGTGNPISVTAPETETGHWSLSGGAFAFVRSGGSTMSTSTVTYATGSVTDGVDLSWGGGTPQLKTLQFTK